VITVSTAIIRFHAFLRSGDTYITLDDPLAGPTGTTEALGINNAGQIVGYFTSTGNPGHGFLYNPTDGTYTTLNDPLATKPQGTFATDINNAGQIVGYYYTGGTTQDPSPVLAHGFLYNPNDGTYTTLDDPLATPGNDGGTQPFGINDLGQISGTYVNGPNHGFLYTVGTFITLDDPTGFTTAYGLNNTQVVGYNLGQGFLVTIGPNFPPPAGTTAVMILRDAADGQYGIYDIGNNSILVAFRLGQVGTDWQFAGLGNFNGADTQRHAVA